MGFDIRCSCGQCAISLRSASPQLSLLCGCEDCRQALAWGAAQGGRSADPLPHLFYIRSDITCVQGLEFMQPVQLRGEAKSTRVYCSTAMLYLPWITRAIRITYSCFSRATVTPRAI